MRASSRNDVRTIAPTTGRSNSTECDDRDPHEPRIQAGDGRDADRPADEELRPHHGPQDAEDQPTEARPDLDLPAEDPTGELEADRQVVDPLLDLLRWARPLGDGQGEDVRDEERHEREALVLRE